MQNIIVIGTGGHGREIRDILSGLHRSSVKGFVDDDPSQHGATIADTPVLGDIASLPDYPDADLVIAVGNPAAARRIADRLEGRAFARVISPRAVISARARLGSGVVVFPNAVIGPDCEIGDHCTVNAGATVSHDCVLERHVNVNPGAHIAGNVQCGEGAYVGIGSSIIQGCRIGAGAIIGAGAVVIRDIPPGVTAVGVPARVVERS